ncbi:hypothetical protein NXS19_006453 [Fusarium pseudograminearum]|nr:hypothetical protein NXS19_006453 [Fusarium pseudograminearum]
MATIGALITILRLGFAPMAQEVISLEPRSVNTTDKNAIFGFAHSYNRSLYRGDNGEWPPDPYMQAAMIKGLYAIDTAPLFNCSGVCLWNDRCVSLGFKSVCENVTSDLPTYPTQRPYASRICNVTTPGGIILSIHQNFPLSLTSFRSNTTVFIEDEDTYRRTTNLTRFAIYRTGRDDAYLPLEARANGSVFFFNNTQTVDLEWNETRNFEMQRLVSSPTKADIPEMYVDWGAEMALKDFLQSPTFQLEFVEGAYGNMRHGLGAALGGKVNVSHAFDNMASSMTDYIRSGPNMQLATGVRIDTEIFVAVRWYWLVGPGLVELASLLFAVATIVGNTRKQKVPLWKSSALVLLACQHDADEGLIRGTSESVTELEKRARGSKVRLE